MFVWPARAGSSPPLDVSGEITRSGDAPLPLRIESARVVPDADGFDRYVVRVVAPQAPSSQYAQRLSFRDPETTLRTATETEIRLAVEP